MPRNAPGNSSLPKLGQVRLARRALIALLGNMTVLTQMVRTSCELSTSCTLDRSDTFMYADTFMMMVPHRLVLLVVAAGVPTLTLLGTCSCVAYYRKRRRRSQLDVAQAGTARLSVELQIVSSEVHR